MATALNQQDSNRVAMASAELDASSRNFATQVGAQIAQMDNETRRALGFGDLALRQFLGEGNLNLGWADLDLRTKALQQDWDKFIKELDSKKPKWWERVLGGLGSIFI